MTEQPAVVVVEDDALVRSYLREVLERRGLEVIETRDAASALDVMTVERKGVSVALIDGLLPDMHGTELALRILDQAPDVAICFVSGALRENVEAVEGIAALTKPLRPSVLGDAIEGLVAWARATGSDPKARREALAAMRPKFFIVN